MQVTKATFSVSFRTISLFMLCNQSKCNMHLQWELFIKSLNLIENSQVLNLKSAVFKALFFLFE